MILVVTEELFIKETWFDNQKHVFSFYTRHKYVTTIAHAHPICTLVLWLDVEHAHLVIQHHYHGVLRPRSGIPPSFTNHVTIQG